MTAIRVLIVDDSAVVRQVVRELLDKDPAIEVFAVASDPLVAMRRMEQEWPDVIVLDLEMPRMDGITFLKRIMAERPTPVVVCSTLTEKGAQTTVDAMAAGAVTIVTKPKVGLKDFLIGSGNDIVNAVKAAARANVRKLVPRASPSRPDGQRGEAKQGAALPGAPAANRLRTTTERVVAIGTSTGGTQALEMVLKGLTPMCPGIVVVQHMPEKFTAAFAARLDTICEIAVKEAVHNDRVLPGRALIAPGARHMQLRRSGAQYQVDILAGPPVKRHCPSVDVLFRSTAKAAGPNALGIIMTGMGDDGAQGLWEMRRAGARTLAQDEASCVVYGMPKEAVQCGAVERTVPLSIIAGEIMQFLTLERRKPAGPS